MSAVRIVHPYTATAGATSVQILPANPKRKYAGIYNPTNTGMWLGLGVDAVIGTGAYAPPGGGYEFDGDNLWQGAVNVIAASGSGHVLGAVDMER